MTMFGAIAMRGLGVLLLVAAALKLYGLAVEPVGGVGIFSEPWVQTLIVEWEIALGIWLVWGVNRALAWLAAMATFATFAAVSAWQGWIGQTTCGCFGALRVNPWAALGVDLAALAVLAFARQHAWTIEAPKRLANTLRPLALGACGVFAILGGMAGLATIGFGSPDAGLAYLRGERLTVAPRVVDVGEGYVDKSTEVVITLRNWTDKAIRIIGGTSDCSCVVTNDLPVTVSPGEAQRLTISLAMKGRPGQFTRSALLYTDDERFPKVGFRLTGRSHERPENEAQ
jgi:hypothetical protein